MTRVTSVVLYHIEVRRVLVALKGNGTVSEMRSASVARAGRDTERDMS